MPYDESLAARVRKALRGRTDVIEKRMFGGLTFMISGKMCCGLLQDELMIRLAPETILEELKSPNVRRCDFTKRPMPGFFIVNAQGCSDQKNVGRWVRLALDHVLSVPPK